MEPDEVVAADEAHELARGLPVALHRVAHAEGAPLDLADREPLGGGLDERGDALPGCLRPVERLRMGHENPVPLDRVSCQAP